MRNILYISMATPYKAVPHAGGKTFYHYIKNLQDTPGFHVELIAKLQDRDYADDGTLSNVKKHYVKNQPLSIMHPVQSLRDIASKINPFSKYGNVLRDSIYRGISAECRKLDTEPDVVILEFTWIVLWVEQVRKWFPKAKIIASEHDVSYLGSQRLYETERDPLKKIWLRSTYHNIKRRELAALSKCDVIMPHNIKDKELLIGDGIKEEDIWILTPYFQNKTICRKADYKTILFYGAMDRPENEEAAIWFIQYVMPALKGSDIQFVILGADPSERMRAYASKSIYITGYVDDVSPYMERCTCAVVPLIHGAGIKVKTLEFLAMGVPVLANTVGIEGIPAINGRDYVHCESAKEYIDTIKAFFFRKIDITIFEENAKKFMKDNFDLKTAFQDYKNILMS